MRISMLLKAITGIVLILALAGPAAAQGAPGPGTGLAGSLVAAGVSFLRLSEGDESATATGFVVDFRKNIYAAKSADLGLVGDLGWQRHSEEFLGFEASAKVLTLMGGIRATASQMDKIAPFGQFLIGIARGSVGGDVCDFDEDFCEGSTDGAVAFGGGLDVRLNDKWNFRAQIDFLKIMEEGSDLATRFTLGVSTHLGKR